jgi:hypothetical protein
MKNRKKGQPAQFTLLPQTEDKTADFEYASHILAGNRWFHIGLSPVEVAALKRIRERIWVKPEKETLGETMRAVLVTALAHYEAIGEHIAVDAQYARSEGFIWTELYQEELTARAFGLPSPRIGGGL